MARFWIVLANPVHNFNPYRHEVEGKEVVIPGLEARQFFVHHFLDLKNEEVDDFYCVTDVRTGLALAAMNTESLAIEMVTQKIATYGIERFCDSLDQYADVASYPVLDMSDYPELKRP